MKDWKIFTILLFIGFLLSGLCGLFVTNQFFPACWGGFFLVVFTWIAADHL